MSLQFILGPSGAGKSHYLYKKIIQESMEHPELRYLILVPEQFTMQTQKELVSLHPAKGILNIDVLSFDRLAYRVFEEVGCNTRRLLEEIGKSFVLQKVAMDYKEEMPYLGGNLTRPGYIYEMKSLISELAQYGVHGEELSTMIQMADGRPQLKGKLEDIYTIQTAFEQYLQDTYMTQEEVLDILGQVSDQSNLLKDSILALDGFTGFTPVQIKLLRSLMRICQQIYVTGTIGEKEELYGKIKEQELFAMTKKMVQSLTGVAAMEKVPVEDPCWITYHKESRLAMAPALRFMEENLFRYGRQTFGPEPEELHIQACKNPFYEVQWISEQIQNLVREKGYRYRDIGVITGDLAQYGDYVRQVFGSNELPYFIDEKKGVLDNPYVEFLRGALQVLAEDYSYTSVFRYLRSGMSDVDQADIHVLENYILALGIRGHKAWSSTWERHYRGQKIEELSRINQIRQQFMEELESFYEVMHQKDKPTVQVYTQALYQLGCDREIQKKLKIAENNFAHQGKQDLVKEYGQIYGKVMSFLDKLVDVLGQEVMAFSQYAAILEAGFQEIRIGIIPPSTDQILIGDMERTRLKDIKVLFFAGVNDGLIPKAASTGGILSEVDREYLQESKIELKPSSREAMYIQKFYLYLNLTKPSRQLYLSYSNADSQGQVIGPAYLIGNICNLFPGLTIGQEKEELQEHLETPEGSLEYWIQGLRQCAYEAPSSAWSQLYNWYLSNPKYKPQVERLVRAAYYTSPEDLISQAAAKALYGQVLENSATRLERFAACAFSHFVQYGLLLRERQQYEFTGMDLGNIVHTGLELFSRKVVEKGYDWRELTDELRNQILGEALQEVVHDYGNTILHSSSRNEYMIQRVGRILERTVWALQQQIERSDFTPYEFEVSFHLEETLELQAEEADNTETGTMKVKGRIDRLDTCREEDQVYVKVIDYKSGNTSFDLTALYQGLQLQLVLYMNAAMELVENKGEKAVPAGIFYYNVKDPVKDWIEEEKEEDRKERLLDDLKVNGLLLEETPVIERLDRTLKEQKESHVIPVRYKKDGQFSAASSVASKEQFQILSGYVKNKVKEIGSNILQGQVQVNPFAGNQKDSCIYCPYGSICAYDSKIPGYKRRVYAGEKKDVLWQKMKMQGKEEQTDGDQLDTGATESH